MPNNICIPPQSCILACSGGPDSVYLLHQLLKKGCKPILAHFNHQLRGTESDADEQFVQHLAAKHHLIFEVERTNVTSWAKQHKKSIEEAGRLLRYIFLEHVRRKYKATAILTAHHLNDNLETVLMNKKRGCHLRGLIGMREQTGFIVRPLLNISKEKILNYLHKHHIPYRMDSSNDDERYLRNQLRHNHIPQLLKKNPNLFKDFKKDRIKAIKKYTRLEHQIQKWLTTYASQTPSATTFPLAPFQKLPQELQNELLVTLYAATHGSTYGLKKIYIKEVQTLLANNRTGKQKRFGTQLMAYTQHKYAIFCKNNHIPVQFLLP